MAWSDDMIPMVRHLVNDITSPQTYTDNSLTDMIVVSAQLIQTEMAFDKTYVIDIPNSGITPDPTATTRDDGFINLTALKSSCVLLQAEAKTNAGNSFKVKDGSRSSFSEIDMTQLYKASQERANKACEDYEQAKIQYQAGNSRAGEAIIGPHTTQNAVIKYGNII